MHEEVRVFDIFEFYIMLAWGQFACFQYMHTNMWNSNAELVHSIISAQLLHTFDSDWLSGRGSLR